ncbi:MAG: hypothetical protein HC841_00405 [Verrucomicrobiae bacterium]|nr:hypothetical protein [Verrucomicrobiae bacterium]
MLRPGELLIDDDGVHLVGANGAIRKQRPDVAMKLMYPGDHTAEDGTLGAVPRDYAVQPQEVFADPSQIPLIAESEYEARIQHDIEAQNSIPDLLDLYGIPSTDQNGDGFCWIYSVGGCVQVVRVINNQPQTRMNPHSVGAIIKGGRNEGGWCGLGAEFVQKHGMASMDEWPEHSRDVRRYDTPEMREHMKQFTTPEMWIDLHRQAWDRNLARKQIATLLLSKVPVAADFAWWGHSVMLVQLVLVERGSFGWRFRNSWTDRYGDRGYSVIRGSKMETMGAVALLTTNASSMLSTVKTTPSLAF